MLTTTGMKLGVSLLENDAKTKEGALRPPDPVRGFIRLKDPEEPKESKQRESRHPHRQRREVIIDP